MIRKSSLLIFLSFFYITLASAESDARAQFVSLKTHCPELEIDARYAGVNNFTGTIVNGYEAEVVLLERSAASKLCQAAKVILQNHKLTLKIFDGYRPVQAVEQFMLWAQSVESNQSLKELYYPRLERKDLVPLGYIAEKSGHSRGSTVDLTLYDPIRKKELDMGGIFDFFDEVSHTHNPTISDHARKNRDLLVQTLAKFGFVNYSKEWWHFTYKPEKFPDQYFDFPVK